MEITNPQTLDHIIGAYGNVVRCAVKAIGPWDVTITGITSVAFTGITTTKIIGIDVTIIDDAESQVIQPVWNGDPAGTCDVHWNGAAGTVVIILQIAPFTGANYNSVAINRGYVTVWYIE